MTIANQGISGRQGGRHLTPRLLARLTLIVLLPAAAQGGDLSPLEHLGKRLFFDANLSSPAGQSCASCHAPEVGFSGPNSQVNQQTAVYPGAQPGRFGNRKPPSAAYASFSPEFSYDAADETFVGGQFWDGRANTLVEQAKGPFLNPLEMNNASARDVAEKIKQAEYRPLFERVHGQKSLQADAEAILDMAAQAIAAYESSSEVNSFSSKYDAHLAGRAALTPPEQRGLELFKNKAGCQACHPCEPGSDGAPPLFTDFTYDNVGAPRNARNPFYQMASANPDGAKYRDLGLGGVLKQEDQWGKVKVPTLRNIGKKPSPGFVKAYLHNGCFKSLKEVVRFYNARDSHPGEFPSPDVVENVNREELGNLQMTDAEENDLVAFLETLSDGYFAPEHGPRHPPGRGAGDPPGPVAGPTPASPSGPFTPARPANGDLFRGARDVLRLEMFQQRQLDIARQQRDAARVGSDPAKQPAR
jgi:cytochrome c peroxidase